MLSKDFCCSEKMFGFRKDATLALQTPFPNQSPQNREKLPKNSHKMVFSGQFLYFFEKFPYFRGCGQGGAFL